MVNYAVNACENDTTSFEMVLVGQLCYCNLLGMLANVIFSESQVCRGWLSFESFYFKQMQFY